MIHEFFIMKKIIRYLSVGTLILLFAVVFYCGLFIFHSLDMTDTGFHATTQSSIIYYGIKHYFNFIWLSDYIGAVWIDCCSEQGVIGLRIGWVLIIAFGAIVTFTFYGRLFKNRLALLASFFAAVCVASRSLMSLNYDSVPSIFLLLLMISYLVALVPLEKQQIKNQDIIFSIISGVIFTFAIQTRIMLILFLCVPITLILSSVVNSNNLFKSWRLISQYFLLSFVASYLLFMVYLNLVGMYDHYIQGYLDHLNRIGVEGRYITRLLKQLPTVLVVFMTTFLLIIAGLLFPYNKNKHLTIIFRFLTVFITISIIYLFLPKANWNIIGVVGFSILLAISTYEIIIIYMMFKEQRDSILIFYIAILIFGLLQMFLQSYGASAALGKASNGMWLIVPITLLLLPTIGSKTEFTNKILIKQQGNFQIVNFQIIFFFSVVLAIAFWTQLKIPYGDAQDRSLMTFKLDSKKAKYIRTTKERALRLDEVVSEIRTRVEKGEPLFIYNYAPMLYFLTDTIPATPQTGVEVFYFNNKILKEKIDYLCESENRPRYAVAAKFWTKSQNWELGKQKKIPKRVVKKLHLANDEMKKCNPTIDWESTHFVIYKLN